MVDKVFGIHAATVQLRAQRAEVLASNLANTDTPGYKARDLDFSTALAEARGGAGIEGGVRLASTNARHLVDTEAFDGALRYRTPMQPALDGNTVELHVEQGQFMENAVQYQASLEFLNGRIRTLRLALRGE